MEKCGILKTYGASRRSITGFFRQRLARTFSTFIVINYKKSPIIRNSMLILGSFLYRGTTLVATYVVTSCNIET